jgi:SpoVK/Ycf46/Vps4 family AAA+-type ATPase
MSQHFPSGQGFRPRWTQELLTLYLGRVTRQFVLHFNITDFVVDLSDEGPAPDLGKNELIPTGSVVGTPKSFREYLHDFLHTELRCEAIYTYSLAGGLLADESSCSGAPLDSEIHRTALQRAHDVWAGVQTPQRRPAQGQPQEGQEVQLPDKVSDNLKLLGHMLRQRYGPHGGSLRQGEQEAPIAVILDYAEKLIPFRLGEAQGDREQLQALETVQSWALDTRLRQTQNIVILLTTNRGQIATSVYAGGSGCRAIRVHLPNEHERKAFIQWRIDHEQFVQLSPDEDDFGANRLGQVHRLAKATQGMHLSDIDNLSRRVWVERLRRQEAVVLKMADVQHEKAEVIQAQSEQLLEILRPRRGFDEIGGLVKLKEYLNKRTGQMRNGQHTPLVPSGLLLAGPPGTGKTIIAEALALESGFNLVKMRNIQDRWVGSSERNLEMVMHLLHDLHPVVVFVDEIDQAMGRRDTGQNGDSGVGARMFARILEEMSNASNRGRILWVAATNRVDLLDDALLRRFDRVIPLLTPDVDESCRIFATMPVTIKRQGDDAVNVAYNGDLTQSGREINGRPAPTDKDLECFREAATDTVRRCLTGAGIEIVVRRAAEIACEEALTRNEQLNDSDLPGIESRHLLAAITDFKPNHNIDMYDYQSLLAIRGCNFHSVMPTLPKREIFDHIKSRDGQAEDTDGQIDMKRLDDEIRHLAHKLYGTAAMRTE